MKYHIFTYGCQMNISDSERLASALKKNGHKPAANTKDADLIVINACSVRQSAIDRVYGQINNFPDKKIILAGCVLDFDKKRLTTKRNVALWHPDDYFCLPALRQNKLSALVPIMTGCNNFCSYCVVPFTRGHEKSRPSSKVINEIKLLIKTGNKEIILIGQNVNSYKDKKTDFPMLLKKINALPGNFQLSFLTSHPKDMSNKLIETIAKCKKIVSYIHLPAQSGDDKILSAMNRHYTVAHYKNLIKKIRTAFKKYRPQFPPLAISTDMIVGFPGETKQQFQNTAKLAKEIGFDMIYFAQYSPRSGTAAAKLKDDVPQSEKKKRAQTLNEILRRTALKKNKAYVDQTVEVLINEIKKGSAIGKTFTNKTVKLPAEKLKIGELITAGIISAKAWGLKGIRKAVL